MNIYDVRVMLEALKTVFEPKTFLQKDVFNGDNPQIHNSKHVDIDIKKGKRNIASYVSPLKEGKVVTRDGFTTKTFNPPYVKEKMVTTASDILRRNAGEVIYQNGESPMERAAKQVGEDLKNLDRRITRLEEVQASQALQYGKVTCEGDGISKVVDFGMSDENKIVLTGTDVWSDATNSKPLSDLGEWVRIATQKSGIVPTNAILGSDAIDYLLETDQISNKLDTRRVDLGEINPRQYSDMGVQYIGHLKKPSLDLWTYEDWYYDVVEEVEKPLIDDNRVVLYNPSARYRMHYGAIEDLKAIAAVKRFPKSWETEDPSARFIMLQSAPIPVPHDIDSIISAIVA